MASAFLAVLLLATGHADAAQPLSAPDELARLRQVGADAYVRALFADDLRHAQVLSRIEVGRPEWLGLAQAMKPAADGAFAEDLDAGVAKALVNNPRDVLKLLSPEGGPTTWRIKLACQAPIATPGKAWLRDYKAKAIRAVSAVRDPGLSDQKRHCLQALDSIDLSNPPDFYE